MQATSKLFLYHQGVIKRLGPSNKSLKADDKKVSLQAPLYIYNLIFKQKLNVNKWKTLILMLENFERQTSFLY